MVQHKITDFELKSIIDYEEKLRNNPEYWKGCCKAPITFADGVKRLNTYNYINYVDGYMVLNGFKIG